MAVSSGRSIALDFFRGLAMLVIVVDHIGGSILSRYTPHTYAFPDAAEAFVFLSGFALASAWEGWQARDPGQASRRLLGRVWPIYRAFLICAASMLVIGAMFNVLSISAPNLKATDIDVFLAAPSAYLVELLTLQRQPYLASILPMYLAFVLAAPAIVPLGLRRPVIALLLSLVVWFVAPSAASVLPSTNDSGWEFNPFAWQLMFMLGVAARSGLMQRLFSIPSIRRSMGLVAVAVVVGCAAWRIVVEPGYLPAELKQNLSLLRVGNFIAIAWVCALPAYAGWIARQANRIRWIVLVGRESLLCFLAGAVISLVVDAVLFNATRGLLDYPAGLLADGIALTLIIGFALFLDKWRRASGPKRTSRAVRAPQN